MMSTAGILVDIIFTLFGSAVCLTWIQKILNEDQKNEFMCFKVSI